MKEGKNKKAYEKACQYMPGGVNSPVRSFYAVGGTPRFIQHGKGSLITDIDSNEYIDYVGSWGPLILGHADESVVAAVAKFACRGLTFGAPTEVETQLAKMICQNFKSIEQVRLVNSGTEAVASVLRLTRGYTGKRKFIKAAGCYHGHVDQLLVQAGSGVATLGLPTSAGIPKELAELTIVVPYNDLSAVESAFAEFGDDIAGILIEPIAGNMGVVAPLDGYLQGLRKICDKYKSLLIFDEVITGFRVSLGGAQKIYGVKPDLTVLGKIIGGGLPVGAYGGRREIMQMLSPVGPVYQAGTLSGNPLAVAAGIATIQKLQEPGIYEKLENLSKALADGLSETAIKTGIDLKINRVGSMMTPFFSRDPVRNYDDAKKADQDKYISYFHNMLERGIYLPPSAFESMFVSLAHTQADIEYTIGQARISFEQMTKAL